MLIVVHDKNRMYFVFMHEGFNITDSCITEDGFGVDGHDIFNL